MRDICTDSICMKSEKEKIIMRNKILWLGALLLSAFLWSGCVGNEQLIQYDSSRGDGEGESESEGDAPDAGPYDVPDWDRPDGDRPDGDTPELEDGDIEEEIDWEVWEDQCLSEDVQPPELPPGPAPPCRKWKCRPVPPPECWACAYAADPSRNGDDCMDSYDNRGICVDGICVVADGDLPDGDLPDGDTDGAGLCVTLDPGGYGQCEMIVGVAFDGEDCVWVSGCGCEPDCEYFFDDMESCREACKLGEECETWADCSGCSVCVDMDGRMTCVGIGVYECMEDAQCGQDQFCEAIRPDLPECGGSCVDVADRFYDIHEWGVNLIPSGGGSEVRTTPYNIYYSMPMPLKPVIYIYGDSSFQLDVKVLFPDGGTSREEWPDIPLGAKVEWNGVQVTQGECDLTPTPQPEWSDEILPEDVPPEIYQLPDWIVGDADCLAYQDTKSRLLFYNGEMPNYSAPIEAEVHFVNESDGEEKSLSFTMTNKGSRPVYDVFYLYRDTVSPCSGGSLPLEPPYCPVVFAELAWGYLPVLQPNDDVTVEAEVVRLESGDEWTSVTIPEGWSAQADTLREGLIKAGLSEAEAARFMQSWNEIFFGVRGLDAQDYMPEYKNGAFVIYRLAPEDYEAALPLLLDPPPRERVRVMVEYRQLALEQVEYGVVEGTTWIDYCGGYEGEEPLPPCIEAAPGTKVEAYSVDDEGPPVAVTISDDEAHYSLQLPPGTYNLVAGRYDWEEAGWVYNVVVEAGEVYFIDITMFSYLPQDRRLGGGIPGP